MKIDKQNFINAAMPLEREMYNIAKSILLYEADCCDVIQTTLFKAYKKLPTLKQDEYFKTWLMRILINECATARKKQKRTIPFEDSLFDNLTAEDMDYKELYACIDSLKHDHRQVVILHYINGYSVEEISELTGVPAGTVKSRLYYARGSLKQLYEEE